MLRVGDWCVDPSAGRISKNGQAIRVEARTMGLLLCLAENAGQVVSIEDLLTRVWPDVTVSPDSVYQAVTSLRRVLGDDPRQPAYIATVPRLGYRMVAKVEPWVEDSRAPLSSENRSAPRRSLGFGLATALALCLVLVAFVYYRRGGSNSSSASALAQQPQNSIAVLPFLDLTEGMHEEEFADGMTEELIDKLSKIPGLRVPAPTASFYYKGKQLPVAEMAKALGVAYVLDGSVRKSGARLRVAARLVRAENGYVVWTDSYDRPETDLLMVQDDIAGEVTKALQASIGTSGEKQSSGK